MAAGRQPHLSSGDRLERIYLSQPDDPGGARRSSTRSGCSGDAEHAAPDTSASALVIALLVGVLLLWLAQRVFARLQGNFAQEL